MKDFMNKIQFQKKESYDIYLIFNESLTEVILQVQYKNRRFDMVDYEDRVGRFCMSNNEIVGQWEIQFMNEEKN
eukprot:snap_masked-scaffold_17-processed-gene-1.23-mRNA-1 protein AED:1.00 eAED:1.00 QI:0/-1/0/0/-1/1/1/0/73